MKIYSSGGVGDALIVAMKIEHLRLWTDAKIENWGHHEKHECHTEACTDIVRHFVPDGNFWCVDKPEAMAKELSRLNHGKDRLYIDTRIKEFPHPYLPNPIENNFSLSTELWELENYIVVQMTAGRLHDNTRRSVQVPAINQLHERFPDKSIVLLGPERMICEFDYPVINLTAKTVSILDALSCINSCGLFVGQDGVMAYYAAMLGKPTVISYHLPNLLNHYWNNHWSLHCCAMVAGNTVMSLPEGCESIFKMVK